MKPLEIKNIRKELGLNQTKFGEMLGVSMRAVQTWESGERNMPESTIRYLKELTNTQSVQHKGVPFYDLDFKAGFLETENNQNIKPDSYISHPFFKGCDYVVRASGQSMAKVIAHGDAIGLIKIPNWAEFFPYGEIYAIVTKDGFRMVKIITKGETEDTYTLISKPTDNKKDEFITRRSRVQISISLQDGKSIIKRFNTAFLCLKLKETP